MSLISRLFPEIKSAFQRSHHPHRPIGALPTLLDDSFFRDPFGMVAPSLFQNVLSRQPAVDVRETDKEYEIVAEVPGVKKENINLEIVNDNTVVLQGHYEDEVKVPLSDFADTESKSTDGSGAGSGVTTSSSSEVVSEGRGRGGVVLANERVAGSFRRVFQFPQHIEPSKISASLKDGLLQVHIPKEETKSAKIEVK
ncbi:hypothetical protein SeLEV6574_g06879 [Synchytrium endobioticum]|nr:hypothetical protein SeLEV6574_g06879 [Synchytrium endobioticum]